MAKFLVFTDKTSLPVGTPTAYSTAVGGALEALVKQGAAKVTVTTEGPTTLLTPSNGLLPVKIIDRAALPPERLRAAEGVAIVKPPGRVPYDGWYTPKAFRYITVPPPPTKHDRINQGWYVYVDIKGQPVKTVGPIRIQMDPPPPSIIGALEKESPVDVTLGAAAVFAFCGTKPLGFMLLA